MKKLITICTAAFCLITIATAQNYRLTPLDGIPSAHIARYTEMPTQEPVLFSWLIRRGWTDKPKWIYATDSTELVFYNISDESGCSHDTTILRLHIDKADMDSLLSMIHSAVATVSYFDLGDFCNIPDTIFYAGCMDCGTMVLQYKWRWAVTSDLSFHREYNSGNLNVLFENIQKAIQNGDENILKAELPYIYKLAARFRSYYPKTNMEMLWW